MNTWKKLLVLLALVIVARAVFASESSQVANANLETIREVLKHQDRQIDLGRTKLIIDRMVDPSIDVDANLKRLEAMTTEIKSMMPQNPSSLQKMEILVAYIYQPGTWNEYRPYSYDLDDPFGKKIRNKLLPTYMSTRKGNCVSMPFLFIILGQRLGLEMTASTVPEHNFVKYRLDGDIYRNFEATSGGPKLDSSFRQDVPMTDLAIKNGIYMRPLSKKETVSAMANVLLEYYQQQRQWENVIALTDLLLEYAPKDVSLLLYKGSASGKLGKRKFMDVYASPSAIPVEDRAYFNELMKNNQSMFQEAEKLGWREPNAASRVNYIQTINRAKAAQQQ